MTYTIKTFIVSFFLLGSHLVYPMEPAASSLNLTCLVPFSSPFKYIPQFVYENCNQVKKHEWSKEHFAKLKIAVNKMTQVSLLEQLFFRNDPRSAQLAGGRMPLELIEESIATGRLNTALKDPKFVQPAEAYDWVYALNLIEKDYLQKDYRELSINDIQAINARMTRCTDRAQGAFRTSPTWWPRRDLTQTEGYFINQIATGNVQNYVPLHFEFKNGESFVPVEQVTTLFLACNISGMVIDEKSHKPFQLNLEEVSVWQEESSNEADYQPGLINISKWCLARMHKFPEAQHITRELQSTLDAIKQSHVHPIEAAARLWFDIIRIHPWHEANKRTGKALGSLILLQHGYLPPLIATQEDADQYMKAVWKGFALGQDGYKAFIPFVVRMIVKTQIRFANQKV